MAPVYTLLVPGCSLHRTSCTTTAEAIHQRAGVVVVVLIGGSCAWQGICADAARASYTSSNKLLRPTSVACRVGAFGLNSVRH